MAKQKAVGKIALPFRVDPDWLNKYTYVPDGIRVVYTGWYPMKFMQLGLLGESGLEMFLRGFPFTFKRKVAEDLIKKGFAKKFENKKLRL